MTPTPLMDAVRVRVHCARKTRLLSAEEKRNRLLATYASVTAEQITSEHHLLALQGLWVLPASEDPARRTRPG